MSDRTENPRRKALRKKEERDSKALGDKKRPVRKTEGNTIKAHWRKEKLYRDEEGHYVRVCCPVDEKRVVVEHPDGFDLRTVARAGLRLVK